MAALTRFLVGLLAQNRSFVGRLRCQYDEYRDAEYEYEKKHEIG